MKPETTNLVKRLKKRFSVIITVFVVILAVVMGRLLLIQLFDSNTYARVTQRRSRSSSVITARRGDILDRNHVLLASSTMEYSLILDPAEILADKHNYLEITSLLLKKCFGIEPSLVAEKADANPASRYCVLKRNLTYSQVKEFMELYNAEETVIRQFLELPDSYGKTVETGGIWLEEEYRRNYPYGTLACSVIGFTEDGTGLYGIEKYYDSELSGTDGRKYSYLNSENVLETVYREAQNGNTLQTTLDYNIQAIVKKHMMEILEESGAKTVAVTVQDPNTGEFLAMEDTGLFDPNAPRDLSARYSEYEISLLHESDELTSQTLTENWKNFCVAESYEPGSTFKAFTIAGALEAGCIQENQIFNCDGSVPIRDYTIHCVNIDGHGDISLTDALAQSCNLALMDIAEAEGVDTFCKYQSQFGFGSYTDIDLPNEMSCESLLFTRENMTDINLATNSFGQRFNVTMVQMSSAFCSLINGGTYYRPYVVKGIYNANGELLRSCTKTVVSRPVSAETSEFIKQALRHVVTDGTGTTARVPGYLTAGKTGTAEKGTDGDLWIASFIGFAPYENPEVVCYVVIDEPAAGGDGSSEYACELFSRIMADVLTYLNAVPASAEHDPAGVGSPVEAEETPEHTAADEEELQDTDEEDVDGDSTAQDEGGWDEDWEYDDTAGEDEWSYEDDWDDDWSSEEDGNDDDWPYGEDGYDYNDWAWEETWADDNDWIWDEDEWIQEDDWE